jgi:hypothetical protein
MQLWNKCNLSDEIGICVSVMNTLTVLCTPHLPPSKDRKFSRCPYLILFKFYLFLNDVMYSKALWKGGLIRNEDTVLFEVFVRP